MKDFVTRHKQYTSKQVIVTGIMVFLCLTLAVSTFYYFQYQRLLNNPQIAVQQEVKTIVKQVGEMIELPPDEQPVVATVTDPSALQSQSFFANSQIGDKLLIFSEAKMAILYRPSANKIIMLAPLNIQMQNLRQ